MAQDIRKLMQQEEGLAKGSMPKGHEERFLAKLEKDLPNRSQTSPIFWMKIAASFVIFFGLGFGAYHFFNQPKIDGLEVVDTNKQDQPEAVTKSLGDISPDLKKVEDYYLASINLELSKVKYTPETKELLDGYLKRLDELTKEYKRLTEELNTSGPNEMLVNALIDNLKFRLNLLYKLRNHVSELQSAEGDELINQTI